MDETVTVRISYDAADEVRKWLREQMRTRDLDEGTLAELQKFQRELLAGMGRVNDERRQARR